MGLREDIQTSVAQAFDTDLLDVIVTFDLVKTEKSGAYDSTTDSYPMIDTPYPSRGVFSSFPSDKVDGVNVKSQDEKIVILGNEITVAPAIDDEILTTSGISYLVVNSKPVMGGDSVVIIYNVQVRKNA
jgi:hypothetical protein